MKKLLALLTLSAFLTFSAPAVYAQTSDGTGTNTRIDDDDDDDDGDGGRWGLLGLLGLAGLLGLKRRDDDHPTRKP